MLSISPCYHLFKLIQAVSLLNLAKPFSHLTRTNSGQNPVPATLPYLKSLNYRLSGYMRNGLLREAQDLFNEMPQRDTVTWNAMIRGYFQNGQSQKALNLFSLMPDRDRDIYSYNTVISGLVHIGDVGGAKELFDEMIGRDAVSWNSMISGYVHEGLIDEAVRLFERMPLEMRNVTSWNLVIKGLLNNGHVDLAKEYFGQMGTRDLVSWTTMMSGLGRVGRVDEAYEVFQQIPIKDVRVWNALMVGYMESGRIDMADILFQRMPEWNLDSWKQIINGMLCFQRVSSAVRFFMEMPEKCQKTWNSILLGLIRKGHLEAAHAFIEKLPYGNIMSWTNIIIGYFQVGEVSNSIRLFKVLKTKDTTLWNVMICGLGDNDYGQEGLQFFSKMKEFGSSPDKATFTSVLSICSDLSTLQLGEQFHAQVIKTGFGHVIPVSNALITMYARCGHMNSALLEFSSMPNHNVISWNSIISGFAHHGSADKAIEMFEQMRLTNVEPNHITFVGILSACSHAGLVDQGMYYFDYMRNKYCPQPTSEHYACIVDLLGRFGLIDEATAFLNQLKGSGIEVPAAAWGALLGACRIHRNIEIGEIAGERVLEREPYRSGVYLILAEMYHSVGRSEDTKRILAQLKQNAATKQPGCSWIEVNNDAHVFLSGDSSHHEFSRICCVVDLLNIDMETTVSKNSVGLY